LPFSSSPSNGAHLSCQAMPCHRSTAASSQNFPSAQPAPRHTITALFRNATSPGSTSQASPQDNPSTLSAPLPFNTRPAHGGTTASSCCSRHQAIAACATRPCVSSRRCSSHHSQLASLAGTPAERFRDPTSSKDR
jgi:hypothetical protein